jgi:hypothetical protein
MDSKQTSENETLDSLRELFNGDEKKLAKFLESRKHKHLQVSIPLKEPYAKEILWKLYEENYNNARHHETQRSTVTNFIIIIAGGISSLVAVGGFSLLDTPLTLLLTLIGIFGALFSMGHYERYKRSKERAKAYLNELDYVLFEKDYSTLKTIKLITDRKRKSESPYLNRFYDTHAMWVALPLLVALLGAALTILCLLQVGGPQPTKVVLVDGTGQPIVIKQGQ